MAYYLSLVIPAYNEGKILAKSLAKITSFLERKKYNWEIVVVDDGSQDNTSNIAKGFKKKGVRLVKLKKNQGKGAALRQGFLNAKGKYVVYTDADLSVSISQLDRVIKKLEAGYRVVVGSRRISQSEIVVHQPIIRENMGKVFTLLTKLVTGVDLADFTCGFKGFEASAGRDIFARSVVNRWAYDAEIMFLAHKLKYKIGQVPVVWIDRRESRVRLTSATITSFIDLLMVRVNNILGRYEKIV
jgi:dolichyl-phosphate beta-glucosyltransferase